MNKTQSAVAEKMPAMQQRVVRPVLPISNRSDAAYIIRSRAPLRLGLAGGGTDIPNFFERYSGYVLNATIDMYACATIKPRGDCYLFKATDIEYEERQDIAPVIRPEGELKLHKAVFNRIIEDYNYGRSLPPFELITYSDAIPGSGPGSSSTMVVAIIRAFVEWLGIPMSHYDIAKLAYNIERKDLAMNGGMQDQFSAAFGGFNFIEFHADDNILVNPLRVSKWIMSELEQSLVLYYTGKSRESAGIIDEQNANIISSNEKTLESMFALKEEAIRMKEYLLKGDIMGMADSMQKSWEAKKSSAKSISNSNIDRVYENVMEHGALAGKVSGAGGGGFMMFIVPPSRRMEVIKYLKSEQGHIMGAHFTEDGSQGWSVKNSG